MKITRKIGINKSTVSASVGKKYVREIFYTSKKLLIRKISGGEMISNAFDYTITI